LVILPLHPRTAKKIVDLPLSDNIRIVDPVGYFDMMALEANAITVATDSGGVQKEAYFHAVPCVTLREETEWTELVEVGANHLVGADADKIAACLSEPLSMPPVRDLYGHGDAAGKIAAIIAERLQ
jgi:UDP-GlcNAc3NAcA epimerase